MPNKLEEIKKQINDLLQVKDDSLIKLNLEMRLYVFIQEINKIIDANLQNINETDKIKLKDLYEKFLKNQLYIYIEKQNFSIYIHSSIHNFIKNIRKINKIDNDTFYFKEIKEELIIKLKNVLIQKINEVRESLSIKQKENFLFPDATQGYVNPYIRKLILDDNLEDCFEKILGKKTLDNILKVIINNEIPLRDILSSYPYFYGPSQILQSALKEDQEYITKIQRKTQKYLKNFISKNIQDIPYNTLNLLFSKISSLFKKAQNKVIEDQEINKKRKEEVCHYIKDKYERLEQQSIYINNLLEFVVRNKSNLFFEDKAELLVKYYNFEEYSAESESIILKEDRLKILFEITKTNQDISNLYCIMQANSFKFSQQVKEHYKDLDILEKRIFTAYEKSWSTTVLNKDYKVTPEKKEL